MKQTYLSWSRRLEDVFIKTNVCWDRERIQKFKESVYLKHLYRNELDKACFSHDAAYSDSKELAKRTTSDKISKDRAYKIPRNCKWYQRALASMVYNFFHEKIGSVFSVNQPLAEKLNKPVIKKFKRRNFYERC